MSRFALTTVGIAVLAAALHCGTINNELTFDDHWAIERNPNTARPADLAAHFTSGFWGPGYLKRDAAWRPLTTLTLAWNRAAGGLDPAGYHAVNLLLHALAAALVALLGRALGLRDEAALAAGALFAVHPVHVDAIAPGVGRADLLMAVLALAAGLAWERRRPGVAAGALALALLAKEMAAGAAAALAWRAVTRPDRGGRWRWALPLAVAAAWLAARYAVLGALGGAHPGPLENPVAHAGLAARLWTAGHCYALALAKFVAPVTLLADYSYAAVEPATGPTAVAIAGWALLATTIAAMVLAARRRPELSAMLAWWLAPYAIVSHLGPTLPMWFAERVLYLPSAGLCLAVGWAVGRAAGARQAVARAAGAAVAVAIAAFSVRSAVRVGDWRDDVTLHAKTVEDAPRNVKALANAARDAASRGDAGAALALVRRALAVRDDVALPHLAAASVYAQLGDAERAAAHLDRALSMPHDLATAAETRCAVLARFRPDVAVPACEAATRAPFAGPDAWMFLAIAYDRTGDPARAEAAFAMALDRAGAPSVTLAYNYGIFLLRRGRPADAVAPLARAAALAPDRPEIARALADARAAAAARR
ncbi:MAG: tetratricopeptide repeat protein [Deltaproteobacteria bacterium]|nr:MAG: tetratricopeptide repeat protein [Deltaproteobacteria bacterium]